VSLNWMISVDHRKKVDKIIATKDAVELALGTAAITEFRLLDIDLKTCFTGYIRDDYLAGPDRCDPLVEAARFDAKVAHMTVWDCRSRSFKVL